MKRSGVLKSQLQEVGTIQNLTAALEGVSSIKVAQIKDKVLPGRECFDELWQTYLQLRVDPNKHKRFIAEDPSRFTNGQTLSLIIGSEGSLSGMIDQRLLERFLEQSAGQVGDVMVLGQHGAQLLRSSGIAVRQVFPLPDPLRQMDVVREISHAIEHYAKITAYYQSYVSLSQQAVRTIDLIGAVSALAATAGDGSDMISDNNYLFEPSLEEIIKLMESTMLQIALREVILDSQLAQQASRFSAMLQAEDRAKRRRLLLFNAWHKARRDESDRQRRENQSVGDFL